MFMKVDKILLLTVFLLAAFLNAKAYANTITPAENWYIGGFLGSQFQTNGDTEIPSIASKPPLTSEPVYGEGYALNLNVGYKFLKSFRIEGELAYQNLPIKKINNAVGVGIVTNVKNSDTQLSSLFFNSYYDLKLYQHWISYLGVGIGYVDVRNTIKPTPPVPVSQNLFFTRKNVNYDTFGYQGILGVGYQLTHNVILNLNYRYFSTFETKATGQTNLGPESYKTKQKITTNAILFGVRYCFT